MDKNPVNDQKIPIIFSTKDTYRKEIFKRVEGLDWLNISAQINQRLQDYFFNHPPLYPFSSLRGAQRRGNPGKYMDGHAPKGDQDDGGEEANSSEMGITIAGFNQRRGEPDTSPFLHFWRRQGGNCCLPVVVSWGQPLIFRAWDFEKPLIKGAYNILIPAETEPEVIPDVILTPLIAFDQHGTRLGKGAGYYDSTLKALRMKSKKPLVIGIAAHQQFIKVLEKESHDEPLDMVVTDKEIIRFG